MSDVFISYSRKDYKDEQGKILRGSIIPLIKDLFEHNGISYWIDENRIFPGDLFAKEIGNAIKNCNIFLFISSCHSNASEWAQGEIGTARMYNKRIIPFHIDDCSYHNSIIVYLSHLDFIDFRKDPHQALDKLVKAVKESRISVILPDIVRFVSKGQDIEINGVKLSNKVLSIFTAFSLTTAIENYLQIIKYLKEGDKKDHKYICQAINQFEHTQTLSNFDLQTKLLITISDLLYQSIYYCERINKLLLQLGLIVCYYYMREMKALINIQEEISTSKFKLTFWEKNGDDIKEFSSIFLGLTAAIVGGGNPGMGLKMGSSHGSKMAQDHKENLNISRLRFEALRDTISSVQFG